MCCKPIGEGICKHANASLTCKMFKYDKYKYTKTENENYKQKYDQLLKENKSLKEQLKNSYDY